MDYRGTDKVEVYAHAVRGLTRLEPDPERPLKYLDFIDIYAVPDDIARKRSNVTSAGSPRPCGPRDDVIATRRSRRGNPVICQAHPFRINNKKRLCTERYPQEAQTMTRFAERFRGQGKHLGIQQGMQQGEGEGEAAVLPRQIEQADPEPCSRGTSA